MADGASCHQWLPNYRWVNRTRGKTCEIVSWTLGVYTRYIKVRTGIIAYPDGRLLLAPDKVPIRCASVEEAKEVGMATYLLTLEGG